MKNHVQVGLIGLLFSCAVGALVPLPERAPATEAVARPTLTQGRPSIREVRVPCPDLLGEQLAELDEAWSDLEAAEASKQALEAELAAFIDPPPSFAGYPPALQPDAIEDEVLEVLDPEVAELEWVDCAEAPCIAILHLVGPQAHELAGMRQAADPLRDAFGSGFPWEGSAWRPAPTSRCRSLPTATPPRCSGAPISARRS